MAFKLGNDFINDVKLGETQVQKIMLGTDLIWHKAPPANTFIGGIGTSLNTEALLAAKLGISSSRILGFKVVGTNVECYISGTYTIASSAFRYNNEITYYEDTGSIATSIENQAFRGGTNLQYVRLPAVTSIGEYQFDSSPNLTEIYLPNLTGTIGFSTFSGGLNANVVITVSDSLRTSYTGGPPPNLVVNNYIIEYAGYISDGSWNTEIKGVSATLNTRQLLGGKIGCKAGALLNLQIVGSDVRFKVFGYYVIPFNAFYSNTDITKYNDNDNLVAGLNAGCFQYCYNLRNVVFNGVSGSFSVNAQFRGISIGSITMNNITSITGVYLFRDTTSAIELSFAKLVNWNTNSLFYGNNNAVSKLYAPLLETLGTTVGNDNVFGASSQALKTGVIITVKASMATVNAGSPDGDLQEAVTNKASTIVYV